MSESRGILFNKTLIGVTTTLTLRMTRPAQRGQHIASKNTTGRIVTDKRARREEQYQLQLAQQQILQDRLNRSRILKASAKKERDFLHLVEEVAAGGSNRQH